MSSNKRRIAAEKASASSRSAKRQRRDVFVKDEIDQLRFCSELLDSLRSHRTADGRLLCDTFLRAPSRRTDPEYFKIITQPIDFTRIQQKLKTEEYSSFEDFCTDICLVVNNNKKYYPEGSQEYKDACDLLEVFESRKKRLFEGASSDMSSTSSVRSSTRSSRVDEAESRDATPVKEEEPLDIALMEELLAFTMELTDETGRLLSPPFRALLPPEEFPTYYTRIKNPMDLKRIAEKARNGEYSSWARFDADFRLMCKNAKVFNEPGSVIYKDATAIAQSYAKRRSEICKSKAKPLSPKKMRENSRVVDELLSLNASNGADVEYSEDSEEDEDSENNDDPKWVLYWSVRNEPNPADADTSLSDPFLELPSKSWYPDYYDEISTPMSLFMINKKLKRGEYGTLNDVLSDLTLVFENARSYNLDGSEIHTAAMKLEKLAVAKAQALLAKQEDESRDRAVGTSKGGPSSEKRPRRTPRALKPRKKKSEKIEAMDSEIEVGSADGDSAGRLLNDDGGFEQSPLTLRISSGKMDRSGGRPGRKSMSELLSRYREKLRLLWNSAYNFMDGDRRVVDAFMVLPSPHEYPEYYNVIERPIDMSTVRSNIDDDRYASSDDFMADVSLLFSNARTFNEPGSQIYKDASTLESVVRATLASIPDAPLVNPMHLKAKLGWLRTKLPPLERARPPPIGERILAKVEDEEVDESGPPFRSKSVQPSSSVPRAGPSSTPAHHHQPSGGAHGHGHSHGSGASASQREMHPSSSTQHSASSSACRLSSAHLTAHTSSAPASRHGSSSNLVAAHHNAADQKKLIELYSLIKNFRDSKGRNLSAAFLQLPSKLEYPDYYDVIRKPLDMAKIGSRISSNYYESIDNLIGDFIQMFDNACRYNEPESSIYKDALSLQKIILQKKREVCKESGTVLDVSFEVRTILTSLFVAVNNHQDRDGRCYSDSLAEVPALLRRQGVPANEVPFSLDDMKQNIDKGRYRRLDRFQEDLFQLFNAARDISRTDSQLFEDSVELQLHFIRTRDDLTRNYLISPARYVTERAILHAVDALRKKKQPEEARHDAASASDQGLGIKAEGDVDVETVGQGGCVYRVHDYAYVAATSDEPSTRKHIMRIERLYRDSDGVLLARGIWCYRPEETFHLATRKFLQNEVFLTPYFDTVTVDRLGGKCHVMFIRHFLKEKPLGFSDEHVYVCESRYMGRQLHFKKMKQWPFKDDDNVEYEKRDEPLMSLSRVASVFANQKPPANHPAEGHANDAEDNESSSSSEDDRLKNLPPILHKRRVEVPISPNENHRFADVGDSSFRFYEQMEYNSRWFQLGDFVHVYNPVHNRTSIMRIDRLWKTPEGDRMFSGPYFARPSEIDHEPTRMFYKREVFGVEQPDVIVPLDSVQDHCVVLLLKDFIKMRPTEIEEPSVYVVEYKVSGREPANNRCSLTKGDSSGAASVGTSARTSADESVAGDSGTVRDSPSAPSTATPQADAMSEASARKLKALKTYNLSADCLEPEFLIFKTAIAMEKEMSPLLMHTDHSSVPMEPLDDMDETASESLDGIDGKQELVAWLAAQPKLNARSKSGYILFSAEIRKRIMQENPEAGFGEVSKIVGVEWKKLTEEQKKQYEVRAEYIASERAKQEAREPSHSRLQPGQIRVFMCKWQSCDFQFDTTDGLYEHVKTIHTSQIVDGENQYVCLWTSCLKYRKEGKPFPSLPRLHRHIKEKHLTSSAKSIYPNQRSKNFFSYQTGGTTTTTYIAVQQPTMAQGQPMQQQVGIAPQPVGGYVTQAVVATSPQIITGSYVNGTATVVAVAPTAYVATSAPTVVHATTPHGYHPYQQVRQVTAVPQTVTIATTAPPPQTFAAVQPIGYGTPSTSQAQASHHVPQAATLFCGDPGRTVVQAPKAVEPVFVAPPSTIHVKRVMHSEAYLRYIESLSNGQQRTVSKWSRSLQANQRNTSPSQKPLPLHWLKDAREGGAREEDVVKALWRLRDSLIENTLNIAREVEFVGPL